MGANIVENKRRCPIQDCFVRHENFGIAALRNPHAAPVEFWLYLIRTTGTEITIVVSQVLDHVQQSQIRQAVKCGF
jgi:hypothetical protein